MLELKIIPNFFRSLFEILNSPTDSPICRRLRGKNGGHLDFHTLVRRIVGGGGGGTPDENGVYIGRWLSKHTVEHTTNRHTCVPGDKSTKINWHSLTRVCVYHATTGAHHRENCGSYMHDSDLKKTQQILSVDHAENRGAKLHT